MAPAAGGTSARTAFVLALLLSAAVLFTPDSGVPSAPPGTDKVVHLLLFAGLAVSGRWAGVPAVRLGIALTAYAAASELVQAMAPIGRSMSVADGAADVIGVAVGLVAWRWGARRGGPARLLSCAPGPRRET